VLFFWVFTPCSLMEHAASETLVYNQTSQHSNPKTTLRRQSYRGHHAIRAYQQNERFTGDKIFTLIWFDKCALLVFICPNTNCLFLCVEQHQHYVLLAWHTSRYFMVLDQISPVMQICWYALLTWCPRYLPWHNWYNRMARVQRLWAIYCLIY
jgi:hypothetical protein